MRTRRTRKCKHKLGGMAHTLARCLGEAGSVYRVCADTGLDQTQLTRFLRGEQTITLRNADILAAYFGVRVVPPRR